MPVLKDQIPTPSSLDHERIAETSDRTIRCRPWSLICGGLLFFCSTAAIAEVQFNRDVRPILARKCFRCHGADAASRQADLRLDDARDAQRDRDGVQVIVPEHPNRSELVRRVYADSADELMPPPDENMPLTDPEKGILKAWVAGGAKYERHWAFVRPEKAFLPPPPIWGTNEIDRFIHHKLMSRGLRNQRSASRSELIRRVTIDLTGLPPTLDETDAFVNDDSAGAYERVVQRLLNSPQYGERMAMWWLDGARYGDSHGYDNDLENSQWPWRNWVIESFQNNQPFSEFTIEQIAGDLLPHPTEHQILATAFNRNHRIQTEDGAIDEEWRTEYVIDRVETIGTVWMGLTLGCARCHDHKYDPISQKEFYQLFALFNNLDEKGFINNLRGSAEPRMRYRSKLFDKASKDIAENTFAPEVAEAELKKLETQFPYVMIMRDMPQARRTHVLLRGQFNALGEEVTPRLPSILTDQETNVDRLAFARWLVKATNPLTARVFVNRLWEQFFGTGLVATSENFGVQADYPSHPDLLDWLAVDFVESGWNVKRLIEKIVTSATYRQSHATDETRQRFDPNNRWLSRGPRLRLQAEMIRDQALAVSGLLDARIGGPSVRPYQPQGLWKEVEKRGIYQQSHGNDLYRRSLYTAIRRTVVTPEMTLFDMPSREICTVKRARTNTPLQALALMNDVTFVEAAKKLAEQMASQGRTVQQQISWGFRRVTQRVPTETELSTMVDGFRRRLVAFQSDSMAAQQLLAMGESRTGDIRDAPTLAALTTVANVVLNLDEVLHR